VTNERAAYYGPDEKLVATDARASNSARSAFEEYRYDALGRRVWVRSVITCNPSSLSVECNTPYVRRTIWDGVQELAEIQVPVDVGNPAIEEMDTGYPIVSWNFSPKDPNPFFGRVVYGPGLAVDQSLTVTRYDYRDQPSSGSASLTWPRFTWQIYWNYQGLPTYGTLTTGAWAFPYQLGPGQTSCPVVGNQTEQRCVLVQWPLMHSAYDQNRGNVPYPSWHGSLLEGKRDRSGLQYNRNRMYDPQTGRFTQEDPIGLAGGLNLYGFASGDPVNFGDAFGLKVCFRGAGRRALVRATEEATGSTITLDSENCIASVSVADTSLGYAILRSRLMDLVGDPETYTVALTGRGSHFDPASKWIGVDLNDFGAWYKRLDVNGQCAAGPPGWSLPALLSHELLGHAFGNRGWWYRNIRGTASRENYGMAAENVYHGVAKEPVRCGY
jgi:RHS repeat-associated protein